MIRSILLMPDGVTDALNSSSYSIIGDKNKDQMLSRGNVDAVNEKRTKRKEKIVLFCTGTTIPTRK
jgi:hypothetical protein